MPKRKSEEKIEKYKRKIRRLEQKRRRTIISDSDSDRERSIENNQTFDKSDDEQELIPVPELDPDIISALGETLEEAPSFGPKINENLSKLWLPILRKGLDKEAKEKLLKEYAIPVNCTLLQAPILNPEILAAVSDGTRARDKRVEGVQRQLGLGITALNKGLELLLDKDRLPAIKLLSDSCRILCDLHYVETEARKKFVTPGLDKTFLNVMQNVSRDETLFGSELSEKIKVTKDIEKHGLQIKKPAMVTHKQPNIVQPSSSRLHTQGNWRGPSRFPPNRGGRGGGRKTMTTSRRAPSGTHFKQVQHKRRAPTHHQ